MVLTSTHVVNLLTCTYIERLPAWLPAAPKVFTPPAGTSRKIAYSWLPRRAIVVYPSVSWVEITVTRQGRVKSAGWVKGGVHNMMYRYVLSDPHERM
jgi:hypothetical protein